jgi:hypothetical protein
MDVTFRSCKSDRLFPDTTFAATQTAASHSSEDWLNSAPDFAWDTFLNYTTNPSLPDQVEAAPDDGGVYMSSDYNGGVPPWTDMFLGDSNIDWIGLSDILTSQ